MVDIINGLTGNRRVHGENREFSKFNKEGRMICISVRGKRDRLSRGSNAYAESPCGIQQVRYREEEVLYLSQLKRGRNAKAVLLCVGIARVCSQGLPFTQAKRSSADGWYNEVTSVPAHMIRSRDFIARPTKSRQASAWPLRATHLGSGGDSSAKQRLVF